jgi:hypothetical protein
VDCVLVGSQVNDFGFIDVGKEVGIVDCASVRSEVDDVGCDDVRTEANDVNCVANGNVDADVEVVSAPMSEVQKPKMSTSSMLAP